MSNRSEPESRSHAPKIAQQTTPKTVHNSVSQAPETSRWVASSAAVSPVREAMVDRAQAVDLGDTLLALRFGLWAAAMPLGFEDALVAYVAGGGDTDTNAAVTGGVLSARYGASGIPARWLAYIPQRARMERLADGLLAMAGG